MSLPSTSQINNIDVSVKSRHMSEGASCITETMEIYGEKINSSIGSTENQMKNYGSFATSNSEDIITEPVNEQYESAYDSIDGDTSDSDSDNEEDSCCLHQYCHPSKQKLKAVFHLIFGVELVAAVFSLAWGLIIVINTNLLIDKVCSNTFNYSDSVCGNLSSVNSSLAENQVQKEVTKLNMYGTLLSSVPVMIIAFIIGPLSDRYGRKIALIPPLFGFIVAILIVLINVNYWSLPAECILLVNIYACFGGFTSFNVGVYAYIGDTTSELSRTTRYSLLDASVSAAMSIGTYISGPLFSMLGYQGVYLISLGLFILDLLLVIFCLKGTITLSNRNIEQSTSVKINPISTFRSVFKKRTGVDQMIVAFVMFAMVEYAAIVITDFDYIYTRKVLGWNEQTFCKAMSLSTILKCLSSVLLLPLLSYVCEMPDSFIGMLATQSLFGSQIFAALTRTDMMFVISIMWGALVSMFGASCKSILSKIVTKEELGQIYSVYGGLENVIPLFIAPIMTTVYNSTVDTYPSTVYHIKSGMSMLLVVCFIIVSRLQKRGKAIEGDTERTPLLLPLI